MKNDIRNSGIEIVGNIPWGTNFCQFYQAKEDLIEIIIPYFKAGLENNEFCLWIIPESLNAGEARKTLRKAIPNFNNYLEKRQIELIPYADWYMDQDIFDSKKILDYWIKRLNQVLISDYEGLRFAEEIFGMEKDNRDSLIDYEERLNSVMSKSPVIALHTYSLEMCSPIDIIEIADNHDFSLGKRKGRWERIESLRGKKIRDIKLAENKQKESFQESEDAKTLLETVLKYLPVGVIIADAPSGKLLMGNERVKKIFHGHLPLSSSVEEYSAYIGFHPDGRQYTKEEWPLARAVRNGEEIIGEEIEFQLADGTRRIISVSAAPIRDKKGRITNGVVVDEDITEQKQAEEAAKVYSQLLETVIQNIPIAINLMRGDNLLIELINPAYKAIAPGKDMVGKTLDELWPETQRNFGDICRQVLATGEPYHSKDELLTIQRFPGGPGEQAYFTWSLFSVNLPGGKGKGILNIGLETTDRKQEEHKIHRYNRVLEGINKIFSNIVQTKTEEDLGNACLDVALEVIGGGIGFINLLGENGLMHDIAISEAGWDQCLMYDKTGHRRPPGNFLMHGLYGYVVKSGKSFFTNNPLSHPESIGIPEDHPPLTSFLGVPLILDGKIMGMVGVANREGGYSSEQQEDLEAVAPAIIEALKRKRSEEAVRAAYEEIQIQSEELQSSYEKLQVQSEELQVQNIELEEAYEALQKSEMSLQRLYDSGLIGVLYYTLDGPIIDANNKFLEMVGYTREDLQAGEINWEQMTPPEYRTLDEYAIWELKTIGVDTPYEKEYIRKDGSRVPIIIGAATIDKAFHKGISFVLDITERKKAEDALKKANDALEEKIKVRTSELEEAYRSLKESEESLAEAQKMAHLGNWEWDIASDKVYWSDETYRIFGYEPQEFGVTYDTFLSHVHPEDRYFVISAAKEILNGKLYNIDYKIIRTDGVERVVHEVIKVIFDEENSPVRMRGIVQDVTERKKAEETIAKIENVRKQEIHHRIKNNLQVISSLLDLQAEKFNGKENIDCSEVLKAFKESQDRVISIALIHKELHEGKEIDKLNFSLYLQRLADNLFHTYKLENVNVSLNLDIEENIFFDMDTAVPLGMIVNEIISNSFKYAFSGRNKGEIQIKLKTKEDTKDGNIGYILNIVDNGIGIPKNIDFEDPETLGLQLVNILVDQIDGCIELNREQGTEFTILFSNIAR